MPIGYTPGSLTAQEIWAALIVGMTTVGSIGEYILNYPVPTSGETQDPALPALTSIVPAAGVIIGHVSATGNPADVDMMAENDNGVMTVCNTGEGTQMSLVANGLPIFFNGQMICNGTSFAIRNTNGGAATRVNYSWRTTE